MYQILYLDFVPRRIAHVRNVMWQLVRVCAPERSCEVEVAGGGGQHASRRGSAGTEGEKGEPLRQNASYPRSLRVSDDPWPMTNDRDKRQLLETLLLTLKKDESSAAARDPSPLIQSTVPPDTARANADAGIASLRPPPGSPSLSPVLRWPPSRPNDSPWILVNERDVSIREPGDPFGRDIYILRRQLTKDDTCPFETTGMER